MNDKIELQLYFSNDDVREIKGIINDIPEIIITDDIVPLEEGGIDNATAIAILSILIPLGVAGTKALQTFLSSFLKKDNVKSIEVKDNVSKREIKIKGFTKKETQDFLDKLLKK